MTYIPLQEKRGGRKRYEKDFALHGKLQKGIRPAPPLFKMLEALFELFVPLVMAKIIDVGIQERDLGYILRMCLLMAALGLID